MATAVSSRRAAIATPTPAHTPTLICPEVADGGTVAGGVGVGIGVELGGTAERLVSGETTTSGVVVSGAVAIVVLVVVLISSVVGSAVVAIIGHRRASELEVGVVWGGARQVRLGARAVKLASRPISSGMEGGRERRWEKMLL